MSYITRESEWLVAEYATARILKTAPLDGGLLEWPARLVDAFLLLETEANAENTAYVESQASRPPCR